MEQHKLSKADLKILRGELYSTKLKEVKNYDKEQTKETTEHHADAEKEK